MMRPVTVHAARAFAPASTVGSQKRRECRAQLDRRDAGRHGRPDELDQPWHSRDRLSHRAGERRQRSILLRWPPRWRTN